MAALSGGTGALRYIAAALAAGLWLTGAGQAMGGTPGQTVNIENMAFAPASLSVERGTKVVWNNHDLVPHTVTAAGKFDSGSIAPGKSWTYVATAPGRHDYVCSYHPAMKATLVVRP